MKKLVIFMFIICASLVLTGCNSGQNAPEEEAIETVTSEIAPEAYNNFSKEIFSSGFVKGIKNIQGLEFTNDSVNSELNRLAEETGDIPEERLYSYAGTQLPDAKKIITSAVGTKFKQPSYIPEGYNFEGSDNDIFLYSMLFNNFKFYTPFPVMTGGFAYSSGFYKYFGHFPDTKNKTAITNNKSFIEPLFYASDEDFGLKIQDTERKEEMLLYLTESDASLDELYNELLEKSAKKDEYQNKRIEAILAQYTHGVSIRFEPFYKIPFISITKLYTYDGKYKNQGVKIGENTGKVKNTLGVVRIKINNEENKNRVVGSSFQTYSTGGYAQSENRIENELYYFDRPFVLFLRKAGCDKPYFAVKIKDGKYLIQSENTENP